MGRYTILEDPKADEAVQRVLDNVVSAVKGLMDEHIQAIVLAGGYGRGEGGVYWSDPSYRLVNDLDLLIFVKCGLRRAKENYASRLELLSQQLLNDGQGLKEIDLILSHESIYRFFAPKSVGYYELVNGHRVIYGDLDLGKIMRSIDPAKLPAYEGTNYFRNRGNGLLIAALYISNERVIRPENRKNFQIELQKACQAMGDSCLLMNGQYHYSYQERLKRFKRLSLDIPDELLKKISPWYGWGIRNKLTPDFGWPGDEVMVGRWFEVQETMGEFFLWYEGQRLRHRFADWAAYGDHVMAFGASEPFALKLKSCLVSMQGLGKRKEGRVLTQLQRTRQSLAGMPLLLFSLCADFQIEQKRAVKAAKLLGHKTVTVDPALWRKLTAQHLIAHYPNNVVKAAAALV